MVQFSRHPGSSACKKYLRFQAEGIWNGRHFTSWSMEENRAYLQRSQKYKYFNESACWFNLYVRYAGVANGVITKYFWKAFKFCLPRRDILFIFNMVWPCIFCGTVFVCPLSIYRENDMLFWILPFVHSHTFCMWRLPVQHLDLSFICSHYHGHLVDNWPSGRLFYFFLLPHRADETQPGQNSCLRLQFLAFNFVSVRSLSLHQTRKFST